MTDRDQPTAGVALKRCPFCGFEADIDDSGDGYRAYCQDCDALGEQQSSLHEAITAWNTRAPASGPVEADDRLAVAVEALEFYAQPENWHGVYMVGRGPMTEDWGGKDIDPQYPDGKPGERARQALALLTKSGEQPVTDPYKLDGGEAGE